MKSKLFLVILILFTSTVYSYSQMFKVYFDNTIMTKEIKATDSIMVEDGVYFVRNCDISSGTDTLNSCKLSRLDKTNTAYYLQFFKYSSNCNHTNGKNCNYLNVRIRLNLSHNACNVEVLNKNHTNYDVQKFEATNCKITLNKKEFKKGDIVQGNIELTYIGRMIKNGVVQDKSETITIKGDFFLIVEN